MLVRTILCFRHKPELWVTKMDCLKLSCIFYVIKVCCRCCVQALCCSCLRCQLFQTETTITWQATTSYLVCTCRHPFFLVREAFRVDDLNSRRVPAASFGKLRRSHPVFPAAFEVASEVRCVVRITWLATAVLLLEVFVCLRARINQVVLEQADFCCVAHFLIFNFISFFCINGWSFVWFSSKSFYYYYSFTFCFAKETNSAVFKQISSKLLTIETEIFSH